MEAPCIPTGALDAGARTIECDHIICSNRSYLILQAELMRAGHTSAGPKVLSLTDLRNPAIDWVQLSQGMGVPGVSVETCEHLAKELKIALQEPGPHLIEMILG